MKLGPIPPMPDERPFNAWYRGIQAARTWRPSFANAVRDAVANNPYRVYADVSHTLLGEKGIPSRQNLLTTAGTTMKGMNSSTVIDSVARRAFDAVYTADGTRGITHAQILAVVKAAGAKVDLAFQAEVGSWKNSAGETAFAPVSNLWNHWDSKRDAWVDNKP